MKFIAKRLFGAALALLGISVATFLLIRLVPGDALDAAMAEAAVRPEQMAEMRHQMGLDLPVSSQFVIYYSGLARGDFGRSLQHNRPVLSDLLARLPATVELAAAAILVALVIAVPLGIMTATHRGSWIDLTGRIFAVVGVSMPNFWLALLLVMLFGVNLRLLPSGGYVPPGENLGENLARVVMPALTLGVAMAAVTVRMLRSSLLEVLSLDFVRTARAKGLSEHVVIYGHALRNALIPTVTVVGLQVGTLLGGAIVVEHIFSWPGIGQMTVRAVSGRDYPVVQAVVLFIASAFVITNLVVDLIYGYLDPRIRYE